MVKATKLRYTVQRKDGSWWFRRGRVWRKLPGDPGTDEEASRLYWQLRTGKGLHVAARRNMQALIASYRLTPKFRRLKPRTLQVYEYRLRYIEANNADVAVSTFSRPHIIAARDANADRPAAANQLLAVLSALFEHAIDLGWRTDNPARGVEPFSGGKGHEPWMEAEITRFRATATGPARTAFELCLGTGQRIGDVLRMRWDDIEDGGINVVQEKTGAVLWIPFSPDLAAYLTTLPRGARTTIITRRDGGPMSYRYFLDLLNEAKEAADCAGCVIHGLRKNATVELIEAGCSEEEIMAITGHQTSEMVRLYGRGARQRKLAKQARTRAK